MAAPDRSICDVIVAFRNRGDYLSEALSSVASQEGVPCSIHVIDDASDEDCSAVRDRFASHPDIAWYRNDRSIGPYRSLHRVFASLTTDFIAIQDGDDISLPDRLRFSLESLMRTGADIFAASVTTFGEAEMDCGIRLDSVVPKRNEQFLVNGTMVVRRDFFQRVNGFADFYCGADSEFGMRALFAGARFDISDRIVGKYRKHATSLTHAPLTGMEVRTDRQRWVSPYRCAVWTEIRRRRRLFENGETRFHEFGCLDPSLSRSIACIPEPCEFAGHKPVPF